MNAVRSKSSNDPISYDAAAVLATGGIHQADVDDLAGPYIVISLDAWSYFLSKKSCPISYST